MIPQLLRMDVGIFILHMVLTALFVAVPFELISILGLARDAHWQVYVPVLIASVVVDGALAHPGDAPGLDFCGFSTGNCDPVGCATTPLWLVC